MMMSDYKTQLDFFEIKQINNIYTKFKHNLENKKFAYTKLISKTKSYLTNYLRIVWFWANKVTKKLAIDKKLKLYYLGVIENKIIFKIYMGIV